jgi:hypothetical protein
MKHHFPCLHGDSPSPPSILEGVILVCIDRVFYSWHPRRPFYGPRLVILEPTELQGHSLSRSIQCASQMSKS